MLWRPLRVFAYHYIKIVSIANFLVSRKLRVVCGKKRLLCSIWNSRNRYSIYRFNFLEFKIHSPFGNRIIRISSSCQGEATRHE